MSLCIELLWDGKRVLVPKNPGIIGNVLMSKYTESISDMRNNGNVGFGGNVLKRAV